MEQNESTISSCEGEKKVRKYDEALKAFLTTREAINQYAEPGVFRRAYKKPFKFYLEHSVEECIQIIREELAAEQSADKGHKYG